MTDATTYDFVLLSESNVKKEAVERYMKQFFKNATLETLNVLDSPNRPEQPIGIDGTKNAAILRVKTFLQNLRQTEKDDNKILISIENGIMKNEKTGLWYDICCVGLFQLKGEINCYVKSPIKVFIPSEQIELYEAFLQEQKKEKGTQFQMTFGEYITNHYKGDTGIPKNNWMKYLAGIDRGAQIFEGLIEAFNLFSMQ